MYCPNCGKDCGNANYCPNCGKKLSVQSAAPSAWAPGMPCPHCGGTKLDGKNCAFCGAVLVADPPVSNASDVFDQGLDSYDFDYRRFYPNPLGAYCLSVERNAVVIESGTFLIKRREVIPYRDLVGIDYLLAINSQLKIVFHYRAPNLQTPSGATEAAFKVLQCKFGNDMWYHVVNLICHLAPNKINIYIRFPSISRSTHELILDRKDELETYFERFNPLRIRAMKTLCHDWMISQSLAQEIINYYFNKRQAELYSTDSKLAVRDYNRYCREIARRLNQNVE